MLQIINAIIRRGYWFNNVFFQDSRKFYTFKTFDTEVVNLGSTSAVHAFDYEGIGVKGANWALSRNPLLGDYSILRNYSSFLKTEGATIIITLCPFTSLSGSYEYLDDRYYSFLYPTTIPGFSYIHSSQVNDKLNNPIMYYPWYALFLDIWKSVFKTNSKTINEETLKKDADNKYYSWCHEFSIKDFSLPLSLKNLDGIGDSIALLSKIKKLGDCYHCRTVIVIPPVYHTLSSKFSKDAKKVLFGSLFNSNDSKFIEVFDYFNSKDYANDASLFKDSFLLNDKGAKKFTRQVLHDINLI